MKTSLALLPLALVIATYSSFSVADDDWGRHGHGHHGHHRHHREYDYDGGYQNDRGYYPQPQQSYYQPPQPVYQQPQPYYQPRQYLLCIHRVIIDFLPTYNLHTKLSISFGEYLLGLSHSLLVLSDFHLIFLCTKAISYHTQI